MEGRKAACNMTRHDDKYDKRYAKLPDFRLALSSRSEVLLVTCMILIDTTT
jgi:hypothetical protein